MSQLDDHNEILRQELRAIRVTLAVQTKLLATQLKIWGGPGHLYDTVLDDVSTINRLLEKLHKLYNTQHPDKPSTTEEIDL